MKLAYVAYCTLKDGKPGSVVRIVQDDGTLSGEEIIFSRKALSGASIGSVYEVERASETSWKLASRSYVGRYHDTEKVAEWQVVARSAQLVEDAKKAERAASKELPAAFSMMEPLRRLYARQLPNGKRAIEILLLEYLRR